MNIIGRDVKQPIDWKSITKARLESIKEYGYIPKSLLEDIMSMPVSEKRTGHLMNFFRKTK